MNKLLFTALMCIVILGVSCTQLKACAPKYVVRGPQGGIATSWTWPEGSDQQSDSNGGKFVIFSEGLRAYGSMLQ